MRSRSTLALTVLLALAGVARADGSRSRSIWLECKAPAGWPDKLELPTHLSCRIERSASGPAFWQTLNPFARTETLALVDPFEVEATARLADPFETGRARPRTRRSLEVPSATIDPFDLHAVPPPPPTPSAVPSPPPSAPPTESSPD